MPDDTNDQVKAADAYGALTAVDDQGEPLKSSRVSSVQEALDLFRWMWDGDRESRNNRAKLVAIMNGCPPADPEKLKATGQRGVANINTGLLRHYLTESCRPLLDQVNKVEKFLNIKIKTEGDEDFSREENIIAEEHFRMVTNEPSYNFRKQNLILQYVTHGVTVPFWEDDVDWRWRSEPLGEFLIPHMTEATEDAIEVSCMSHSMKPHQLIRHLKGDSEHWDKEEIKRVLKNACPKGTTTQDDPERMVNSIKDNDLWYNSKLGDIKVVDMWVTESDGKVSHFMFSEDGKCSNFLYKHERRYDHQSQAYLIFTYGVGTNGYYHSIRGLGYEAMPYVQEINRLVSNFIDAMRLGAKLTLQPASENVSQELNFFEHSAYLVMPKGYNVIQRPTQNFAQTIIPGISVLQSMLGQNMSSFSVEDQGGIGDARKTQAEVMARLQQMAQASGGNAELFDQSWSRLLKEQFRRQMRENYRPEEPGGQQIKEWKRRCEARGVDKSIWKKVDIEGTTIVPAVGAGSAAQQMVTMERLLQFLGMGFFDAEGEERLKRMAVRMYTNNEITQSLCGEIEVGRPMQDDRNALFENNNLTRGGTALVLPNDRHIIHILNHLGSPNAESPTDSISDDLNVLNEAMQTDNEDVILQVVPSITAKHAHAVEHLLQIDNAPQSAMLREQLEQIGGMLENAQKRAAAIERERYEAQQEAQGAEAEGQQGFVVGQWNLAEQLAKVQYSLEKNNLELENQRQKLRFDREEHMQNMATKAEQAQLDIALKKSKAIGNELT